MARFIFTQTMKIEKTMDVSFTVDADSFELAHDLVHDVLQTSRGKLRPVCDVENMFIGNKVIDMTSQKDFKVVDGRPCELICFGQKGWKEIGVIDTKN